MNPELMARLREIEDLLLEETQEQIVVEETASLLTQIEVFLKDIPGLPCRVTAGCSTWRSPTGPT